MAQVRVVIFSWHEFLIVMYWQHLRDIVVTQCFQKVVICCRNKKHFALKVCESAYVLYKTSKSNMTVANFTR